MTTAEVLDALWKLSVICGMNQRYHQIIASGASDWDKWIRIGVGIVAIVSAGVSIWSACLPKWKRVSIASALISVAGLLAAVWLNISSADATARLHSDIFRRWSDLRTEVDSVYARSIAADETAAAPQYLVDRLVELTARKNQINALEPAPKRDLLNQCHEREENWRRDNPNQPAPVAAKTVASKTGI